MSVIAPVSASSFPSIHLSDVKCQKIPDEFLSNNYGEKYPFEITAKIPDNITLSLHNLKLAAKTPGNLNELKYRVEFPSG